MTEGPVRTDAARPAPAGGGAAPAEGAAATARRSVESRTKRRAQVERLRGGRRSIPTRTSSCRATTPPTSRAAHDPEALEEGEHADFHYRVMGRVTGKRGHGKVVFFDIRDVSGTIQAYARRDKLGEEAFERIEELDIADLVGVEGVALRHQTRGAGDQRRRPARCWRRR